MYFNNINIWGMQYHQYIRILVLPCRVQKSKCMPLGHHIGHCEPLLERARIIYIYNHNVNHVWL